MTARREAFAAAIARLREVLKAPENRMAMVTSVTGAGGLKAGS